MEEGIQYLNENLWPGRIGHAGIILAFVAALMGVVAYYFATQREEGPEGAIWKRMGRWAFGAHAFGVLTVIGIIFYAMINERYEYQYVWAHVSEDLPMKYIFSAFWEGQEGQLFAVDVLACGAGRAADMERQTLGSPGAGGAAAH
jgi:cytochrome c-type biogenesis protein CcmF